MKDMCTTRLAAALLAALALTPMSAAAGDKAPTVVELFTSQGCSSCPPADALLTELADEDDVIALSFHVDYWDYIGWKDPFASARHTQRQRDYAGSFKLRYVYTPQMVVHGSRQMTGSDRRSVRAAINQGPGGEHVPVALRHDPQGKVVVVLPEAAASESYDVWFVVYDRSHTTAVKRGENRGRVITNRNVVRALRRVGSWSGKAEEMAVHLAKVTDHPGDGCAVVVQSPSTGHIVGAAKLALTKGS